MIPIVVSGKDVILPRYIVKNKVVMSHLIYEQIFSIEVLLKAGKSKTEIGNIISIDKSLICREVKQDYNARNQAYKAPLAQRKYEQRF